MIAVNELLSGKVKVKEAVEVGTKAIEYIRGVDFFKYVNRNLGPILSSHAELCQRCGIDMETDALVAAGRLGQLLLKEHFVVRCEHRPLGTVATAKKDGKEEGDKAKPATDRKDGDKENGDRLNDKDREREREKEREKEKEKELELAAALQADNAKWPRRIGITKDRQTFDTAGFYAILYEKDTAYNHLMLFGIIAGVLCVCLFPIWPFSLKICVWYSGVIFMTFILIIIVVRLLLFLGVWFAGSDFWLFPTLFDEDAGFIESFIPFYSYEKRNDDWLMVGARVFAVFLTAGSFYKLSETHSLSDFTNVSSRALLDVLEWGHNKLADVPSEDLILKSEMDKMTPEEVRKINWEKCVKHCNFADKEEFNDLCETECDCLEDLFSSNCYKSCSPAIQSELRVLQTTCIPAAEKRAQEAAAAEAAAARSAAEPSIADAGSEEGAAAAAASTAPEDNGLEDDEEPEAGFFEDNDDTALRDGRQADEVGSNDKLNDEL